MLVLFPDSNLRASKRHPALVVHADGLGLGLRQTIVAMITNSFDMAGYASRVLVRPSAVRQSGLLMDSVIMAENLATVLDAGIDRVLGVLPDMTEVEASLRRALGL